MLSQHLVGQHAFDACQRVLRRDRIDEVQLTDRPAADSGRRKGQAGCIEHAADGQVGLAGGQGLDGAEQRFVAQLETRGWIDRIEGAGEIEERLARDHAVDRHGEHRLPAGGDPLHAVGDGIDLGQHSARFAQQLGAGFGEARLPRAAIEQQHVERIFDLPYAVAERTRHQIERACGAGETAAADDGLEHRKGVRRQDITRCWHGRSSFK